jgi:hypothetical protein
LPATFKLIFHMRLRLLWIFLALEYMFYIEHKTLSLFLLVLAFIMSAWEKGTTTMVLCLTPLAEVKDGI